MKIGFIGCGNMAKALISGILSSKFIAPNEIIASALRLESLKKTESELGINITLDNKAVASKTKYVVLAVKPQFYIDTINEIKESINNDTVIISIAPGKTMEELENAFSKDVKIIRTMPNTPCMIRAGMTAICRNEKVNDDEFNFVIDVFKCCGLVEIISENLINAVVATSGSSPAYLFMMIEAMADAAVLAGLPRDKAYRMAAQAIYGGAKMVLETNRHPAELKDMVCSPAGTTIEAVRVLEKSGFRSSIIEAMTACVLKAKQM